MPCYGSRNCQAYEACPEGQCIILEAMEDARAEEREACAKVAAGRASICHAACNAGDANEVHPLNEALHIEYLIRNRAKSAN